MKFITLFLILIIGVSCESVVNDKPNLHLYIYDKTKNTPIEFVSIKKMISTKPKTKKVLSNEEGYLNFKFNRTKVYPAGLSFFEVHINVQKEGYITQDISLSNNTLDKIKIDSTGNDFYLDTIYLQPLESVNQEP